MHLIGSLSTDDLYDNDTKQEYDWLKKEKYSCCRCSTNFRPSFFAVLHKQQREIIKLYVLTPTTWAYNNEPLNLRNHSNPSSYGIVRQYCNSWTRTNNREMLATALSCTLECRFCYDWPQLLWLPNAFSQLPFSSRPKRSRIFLIHSVVLTLSASIGGSKTQVTRCRSLFYLLESNPKPSIWLTLGLNTNHRVSQIEG